MTRSNELKVSPVKRYRVPKYPSHADPDPTRVPYPVPYPWHSQAVVAIASLGIAASCNREPESAVDRVAAEEAVAVELPATDLSAPTGNPFPLSLSGLPHVSSGFGTGAPNYLDDDLAREAIERAFASAGYPLQRRYQYDRHGITFVADGYNAEHHLGYVYGSYGSLDRDAVVGFGMAPDGDIEMVDYCLSDLARDAEDCKDSEAAREIASIQRIADHQQREAAFRTYMTKDRRSKISLAEAQSLEANTSKNREFVALVSHFDMRFTVPYYSDELSARLAAISLIPDPVKRDALSKAVRRKAVEGVMYRLEQSVRDYIAWARSQGLQ